MRISKSEIRNPKSERAGFTLIEIMLAMFILSIVIVAIFSSWYAIAHGSVIAQEAAADVQRSRIALRTMEDALSGAQSFGANLNYYGFVAKNDDNDASLSFVSHLSQGFPRSGEFGDYNVRRVTFSLEAGADSSKQLVLRQNPILIDIGQLDEKEHPVVLAKNVHKLAFEFWDPREGDWTEDWDATNTLPPMVKITLQLDGATFSAPPQPAVIRVVYLQSVTVPPIWQMPVMQRPLGIPPVPPGGNPPGQPGQQPGQQPVPPGGFPGQGGMPGGLPGQGGFGGRIR